MNIYLIVILAILVSEYVLDVIVEALNVKSISSELPKEFEGYFDAQNYMKSQEYLKVTTNFSLIKETFFTFITIVFILAGGFNFIDKFAGSFNFGPIGAGLIFAALLMLALKLLSLPFLAYRTFVIEEKFGFNRTTPKTFAQDILKGLAIGSIIGGVIFCAVLWFFEKAGPPAWIYCWIAVSVFELFIIFIAPVVIMPIFNKFVPLEDGQLKDTIENFARQERFALKGVFKMDASRRSAKSNAFFTGFGRFKRIVLFDTLIKRHTVDELVSVLAHEIGHYQKRHILKRIASSILTSALMFYIMSLFINNKDLFAAFKMENLSIYASLFFFAFLYNPINFIFTVILNVISRKHEYEADLFAVSTFKKPEAFICALKKLSVDNLSNLTPHPLKVFLQYSHPPVLKRIEAIRRIKA